MALLAASAIPACCFAQAARPALAGASAAAAGPTKAVSANNARAPAGALAGTAMERAQRAADSPLRAILDAAKVQRRNAPAAPTDRAAPPRAPVVNGGAVRVGAAPGATALAAPRQFNGGVVGVAGGDAAAGRVADVAEETQALTIRTLPSAAPVDTPRRAAPLEASAITPAGRNSGELQAIELPRVRALPEVVGPRPTLLHMVEPEVAQRLLDQLTRPEVTVEFTIRADGTVTAVQVMPPVPRQLVPAIAEAVAQWRYAPSVAPRQHRVQLVFKNGS